MELYCLGVDFRTASLGVRERVAYSPAAAGEMLRALRAAMPGTDVLLLSTCNRTEFHLLAPDEREGPDRLLDILCARSGAPTALHDACTRYRLEGTAAARHLFRVACGLESAILGDAHVLGQLKDAVELASDAGTLGGRLRRTTVHALRAAKRARSETAIARGGASIGAVVAGLVGERAHGPVLIVGAGKIAGDVGRSLAARGIGPLWFVNRSEERAIALAHECRGQASSWQRLAERAASAGAIVAATAAPAPVLERSLLDDVVRRRGGEVPLIVDAGVPRNVAPGASVVVFDIDAIRERQGAALEKRRAAVPQVEAIVDHELAAWLRWRRGLAVEDLVRQLHRDAEAQARAAAGLLSGRAGLDAGDAERLARRCLGPLVHEHVRRLRAAACDWALT